MRADKQLDWLAQWELYSPDKVALKDVLHSKDYTYQDCYRLANFFAADLKASGLQKGDRVAVFAHNRIETIILFFALQRLGAILVPINFRLTPSETDYVISDSGSKLLFFDPEFKELTGKLKTQIECRPMGELTALMQEGLDFMNIVPFEGEFEEPCKILYTSGTTGFPKGVVITPKILFWNSINTTMSLDLTSHDVTVNFSPFFHTGGWNVLLTPFLHRGATTILLPKFDADQVLEILEKEKVSIFFGVPTTLSMMARSDNFKKTDLSSVRYAIVGGEPMPLNMIQLWHGQGIAIRQGFGMTECGPNCFSLSEKDAESKIGSIGRPNFYVQTRVIDENNKDVEPGEVGELLLKGPMCMTHYWDHEEATHSAFISGWLRTGDLVRKDQDDYFYVVGRKKKCTSVAARMFTQLKLKK
jgi:fatty-acyl-CoA synthase